MEDASINKKTNKELEDFFTKNSNKKITEKYCGNHCCIIKDCNNSTYSFICAEHLKDIKLDPENPFAIIKEIQCERWHKNNCGYNNDKMMELSKYLKKNPKKIDIKLLWLSLCSSEGVVDFVNGFKKGTWVLLAGLKKKEVCKDIRELIFYEYLKATIIYYFDKNCYDCVRICSQKECGEIGWYYNPNCKIHVCSKDNCHELKYKTINVCLEHKCHRDKCNNSTHNQTKFCNKHLCPLCRICGTFRGNNFCKKCACKKIIPNEYGTVFCPNPKAFGSKDGFCIEHKEAAPDVKPRLNE